MAFNTTSLVSSIPSCQSESGRHPCQIVVILSKPTILILVYGTAIGDQLLPACLLASTRHGLEVELSVSAATLQSTTPTKHHHVVVA